MPPYYLERPDDEDLTGQYARQLGLMRLMRGSAFSTGAVPRGTPETAAPTAAYGAAMGLPQPEEYGPPQPATRLPDELPPDEGRYHKMVDDYLQSLTQPFRLPEPTPYSRREKLGMLAAREPWQRQMIQQQHEAPYERAVAEAQIGERRRASAAGIASDLEKAQSYERYRLAREGRGASNELDYVDKVEKAQADAGNKDYPYTKYQWKALADFNAKMTGPKTAATKEEMLKEIDQGIRSEEDQMLQARSDVMGMDLGTPLAADRQKILADAGGRKQRLMSRRNVIAGMTPDIYQKFRNLSAEQQEQIIAAYEKRMAGGQQEGPAGLGPVAPSPSYYP